MSKEYFVKPTQRRAMAVWDYFTEIYGEPPHKIWYNARCWRKELHILDGAICAAWGWWGAEFSHLVKEADSRIHSKTQLVSPDEVRQWEGGRDNV